MPTDRPCPAEKTLEAVCILACGVFKPALQHLAIEEKYPHVRVRYLPSNLHNYPQKLRRWVLKRIRAAQRQNERLILLYGDCFPDIAQLCEQYGVAKVTGGSCYEMLLGGQRFRQMMEETAGTYFVERELVMNFDQYCLIPLELHDEEMRNVFFGNYVRMVYVRQPADADLSPQVETLAASLQLRPEVQEVDYAELSRQLDALILGSLSSSPMTHGSPIAADHPGQTA